MGETPAARPQHCPACEAVTYPRMRVPVTPQVHSGCCVHCGLLPCFWGIWVIWARTWAGLGGVWAENPWMGGWAWGGGGGQGIPFPLSPHHLRGKQCTRQVTNGSRRTRAGDMPLGTAAHVEWMGNVDMSEEAGGRSPIPACTALYEL